MIWRACDNDNGETQTYFESKIEVEILTAYRLLTAK